MWWFVGFVVVVFLILAYNRLRRLAETVKARRADIFASIKKRHDIAQRLSDIASNYGEHEKLTHFTVIEGQASVAETQASAAEASRVISNVQTLASRFPELKANEAYQQLMMQLDKIETAILARREGYNEASRLYNSMRGSFPHFIYARLMGFSHAPYFSADEAGEERLASFGTDDGKLLRETMGRMANRIGQHAQSAAEKVRQAPTRQEVAGGD